VLKPKKKKGAIAKSAPSENGIATGKNVFSVPKRYMTVAYGLIFNVNTAAGG
jgi:hypothetical protein